MNKISPKYQMKNVPNINAILITDNWNWKKLGDIADIIGGVSYNPDDITPQGDIRIIRGGNIQNGIIQLKEDDIHLPISYANQDNQVYKYDTVIVSSTGSIDALAKAATCFEEIPHTQIGAFLRIIRPKEKKYAMLISAWCTSQYFHEYLINCAKGTNINNIRTEFLTNFELLVPPDNELLSMSKLYINIEKKLLLNRHINENLCARKVQACLRNLLQSQIATLSAKTMSNLQTPDHSSRVAIVHFVA